ncbi:MAG: hypothetical protein GF334_11795 [Candidatus Altiarchaeales archaeon]|nr:hypothetical protein [Candidatus Altiarchaeales archaeon]
MNTASTSGGDGTTNGTSGSTRAYASLNEAATALNDQNYADDVEVLCCGSSSDVNSVSCQNWTSSSSYTATIKANTSASTGRHPGYWSTSHYRLHVPSSAGSTALDINANGKVWVVENIQIRLDDFRMTFLMDGSPATGSAWRNLIVIQDASATSGSGNHVSRIEGSSTDAVVENCVVVNIGAQEGKSLISCWPDAGNIVIANSLFRNIASGSSNRGVTKGTGNVKVVNSAVFNTNNDFFSTNSPSIDVDYCASDDGDGSNPISILNWGDQFLNADYVSDVDFRLSETSDLLDAGIGPASDSDVPTLDILGNTRSGLAANVGPFEENTAPSLKKPTVVSISIML